jgi:hypothetical protein
VAERRSNESFSVRTNFLLLKESRTGNDKNRILKYGEYIILETSVEWGLKRVDPYFWQGVMRRNNALLQRIVPQQKLTSGVL